MNLIEHLKRQRAFSRVFIRDSARWPSRSHSQGLRETKPPRAICWSGSTVILALDGASAPATRGEIGAAHEVENARGPDWRQLPDKAIEPPPGPTRHETEKVTDCARR
jgi:hypothetical protein